MRDRRQQLRELYGFDFPDDLFRFWDFVNRLRPLEPLRALQDLSIQLVGAFEVLAGRFDHRSPRYSLLLHWRYYLDPPEFFTVMVGGDNLHWGYYLDDPERGVGCVALYYAQDAFEMNSVCDDLFESVRLGLEEHQEECEEHHGSGLIDRREYEEVLASVAAFRNYLLSFGTEERREVGAAYVDRYSGTATNQRDVIAETVDNAGIVVPTQSYRRLSLGNEELWNYLYSSEDPVDLVEDARQALREGFPGTALKLGKDLWAVGGERHEEYAYELLDAAYATLERDVLRKILHVHRENRDHLPSVDILESEGELFSGSSSEPESMDIAAAQHEQESEKRSTE